MIIRTQATLCVQGANFMPSKVPAPFSAAHDPGAIGSLGRYRGLPVPYGSAEFDVPEQEETKIAFVHQLALPYLAELRAAGAESVWLHITCHHDGQCPVGFSKDELKMLTELECDVTIDCLNAQDEPPTVK